jgi:hypothetical protein
MDQFHDRFPVYDDVSSAGNHFHAFAKFPDADAPVSVNGSWTTNPHSGATAIRCELLSGVSPHFGGFYFMNGVLPAGAAAPLPNFGTTPNAGVDLTGATVLTFWARGERGGETIEFFMGGVGRVAATGVPIALFPDSTPVVKIVVRLTTEWQKFTINLRGKNLSYVLGGFGWGANTEANPTGAVFYVDDIQYELNAARKKARLNEPRFLGSFATEPFQSLPEPVGTFDFTLRNTAFIYDNALALLAFLASGTADSLRRARLIGNAFVYASRHDRTFSDGRLRDAYAAGDISLPPGWTPNNRPGTVPIPGFFSEEDQQFFEIFQEGSSTGNNAWAMIGLLALYERTKKLDYLDAARNIGEFIRGMRSDAGRFQGFIGGLDEPENSTPQRRTWASAEHNLDILAAFSAMAEITGEGKWTTDSRHAGEFLEDMFDAASGCYLAGTLDAEHRNQEPFQLPVDVQAWSVLAIPGVLKVHPAILDCAEREHRTIHDGFSGFDFNDDRDGVWFEGTAHMAVAYAFSRNTAKAEELRRELRRAQQTPSFGSGQGIVAACHAGVSSGFGFSLFRRLHVGATAWNVFAQLAFNPFYGERIR